MMKMNFAAKGVLLALTLSVGSAQGAVKQLALVLDGSGSISISNFALQLEAYEKVFSENFYTTFIAPSPFDTLVVSAFQFASDVSQEIVTTTIKNDLDAANFGAGFGTIVQKRGGTNIKDAIDVAQQWILDNPVGDKSPTIDISTDGDPNQPQPSSTARQKAIAAANAARDANTVVNALGVGTGVTNTFLAELVAPTGFFVTAADFNEFEAALRKKIPGDINIPGEIPVPATLALLGVGLIGLRMMRQQRDDRG